ncbi:MAG: phosphate-starvation-inducible PsiE family protein [Methanomicrobiales archaeon]
MANKRSIMDSIIGFFSFVPMIMYMIVAILLTIIAAFSLYDALLLIVKMISSPEIVGGVPDFSKGLLAVIQSLLLTITIIVLFETVTVYFRTKRVEVRALLIAGITGMVRHILIFNVTDTNAMQMFASIALLAVLIAGVVLVKPEP